MATNTRCYFRSFFCGKRNTCSAREGNGVRVPDLHKARFCVPSATSYSRKTNIVMTRDNTSTIYSPNLDVFTAGARYDRLDILASVILHLFSKK